MVAADAADQAFDAFYRNHRPRIAKALAFALGDVDLAADADGRGVRPCLRAVVEGAAARPPRGLGLPRGVRTGRRPCCAGAADRPTACTNLRLTACRSRIPPCTRAWRRSTSSTARVVVCRYLLGLVGRRDRDRARVARGDGQEPAPPRVAVPPVRTPPPRSQGAAMNSDHQRLVRYFDSRSTTIDLPPGDPSSVSLAVAGRRRRRRTAVSGVAALALLAGVVTVQQAGDDDTSEVAAEGAAVAAAPLQWTSVTPIAGLAYANGFAVTEDGTQYGLSTAPGRYVPNDDGGPQTLYRSTDGVEWTTVTLPADLWPSQLAAHGNDLYAVGTSPAAGGGEGATLARATRRRRMGDGRAAHRRRRDRGRGRRARLGARPRRERRARRASSCRCSSAPTPTRCTSFPPPWTVRSPPPGPPPESTSSACPRGASSSARASSTALPSSARGRSPRPRIPRLRWRRSRSPSSV